MTVSEFAEKHQCWMTSVGDRELYKQVLSDLSGVSPYAETLLAPAHRTHGGNTHTHAHMHGAAKRLMVVTVRH